MRAPNALSHLWAMSCVASALISIRVRLERMTFGVTSVMTNRLMAGTTRLNFFVPNAHAIMDEAVKWDMPNAPTGLPSSQAHH